LCRYVAAVPQAADGNLLGFVAAPEGVGVAFSYVAKPAVRGLNPREGSGAGGEPVWLTGSHMHVVDDGAPTHCVVLGEGGIRLATPARFVSSSLLACERPSSPSLLAPFAMGFEAGAAAVGWSQGNQAFGAWPLALAVANIEPGAVSSVGGTAITLHGRGFPSSPLATVCRQGLALFTTLFCQQQYD
jgi:hypothetical protein